MRERLIESRLTPNAISLTGFVLNLAAAGLIVGRMFFLAGIAFIVGSIMDTLDGRYSRMSGKGTPFGAFLDSTIDRVSDSALFVGTALLAVTTAQAALLWWALVALVVSLLVPYVRAKAESLGASATVGPAPREGRIVIFLFGLAAWAFFGLFLAFVAAVLVVAGAGCAVLRAFEE